MSEPKSAAREVLQVAPGVLHWTVFDDRIANRSDAYALTNGADTVLVDPLPLEADAVTVLGNVKYVVLTIQSHQRSAWRIRKQLKVPVFAPKGAEGLEEQPDYWYEHGAELPGGLRAIHAPGPCAASYALHLPNPAGRGVLLVGDLLIRGARGPLTFVPDSYQDDPRATRESVRKLLELEFDVVLPGHGAPILKDGAMMVREALAEDARA